MNNMLDYCINHLEEAEEVLATHRDEFDDDFINSFTKALEACRIIKEDRIRKDEYEKLKELVKEFSRK